MLVKIIAKSDNMHLNTISSMTNMDLTLDYVDLHDESHIIETTKMKVDINSTSIYKIMKSLNTIIMSECENSGYNIRSVSLVWDVPIEAGPETTVEDKK